MKLNSMSKEKKTQSPGGSPEDFVQLWQQKWAEMLKEQGWPEGMAMPGMGQAMGQMPFMMPFMSGFGGSNAELLQRIEALEKRLAMLEKKHIGLKKKTKPKA